MKQVMEDPGIKLFGKKIAFSENGKIACHPIGISAGDESSGGVTCGVDNPDGGSGSDHDHVLMVEEKACSEEEKENRDEAEKGRSKEKHSETKEKPSQRGTAELDDNPRTPPIDEDTATDKAPKSEIDQSDTTNSQTKTLKKPDKILPCPRCNSMDTKFCYYNNYNVNQPRHFCKSCQRYWTAGGTMRNMPVGAGRRKNKNPASHCRLLTITQEAFQATAAAQTEVAAAAAPDGFRSIPPKVISFGLDSSRMDGNRLGVVSSRGRENGDDYSSVSTVATNSNSVAEKMQEKNGFHSQVPCIPGVSWSYNPWNSAIPIPAVCPPGYPPMPFYPSPYWNCIPWLPPSSIGQNQSAQPSSDPNSSTLRKHSRDEELTNQNGTEEEPKKQRSSVLTPKTLRIDDPDEAAKSSIWATLGIKNENISRGNLFKAFQAKGEEKKNHTATNSPVLQANPAALSRSLCFQERA